jgi:polygalacturonase
MTSRRSERSDFDDRSVLPSPSFPTLDILDYGAAADGVRDDTDAFERAIQIIEDHGGGRLRVGPGFYNIRPINMTSNMELYVTAGATIRGIADNTVWPVIPGTSTQTDAKRFEVRAGFPIHPNLYGPFTFHRAS